MAIYTTKANVKVELPPFDAADLPDATIDIYINDASRLIDNRLNKRYSVPFNDIAADPPTPPTVEKIARLLAANDSMIKLGIIRGDETLSNEWLTKARELLNGLDPKDGGIAKLKLQDDGVTADHPHAFYTAGIKRDEDDEGSDPRI